MISAIDALRSDRVRFEPHIEPALRHYLDEQLDPVSWYPTAHLLALLDALVAVPPLSERPRQEVFELFGALALRNDIEADQAWVPKRQRSTLLGAYAGAIGKSHDVPTTLRRMLSLWQLYWDEGEHVAERGDEQTLRVRLIGYAPKVPELCWLHTGFTREAFRLAEVKAEVTKMQCASAGAAECRWTIRLPDAASGTLASFPAAG